MDNKELGKKGEKFTAKYLKKNNYTLLYLNYSTKHGEVDIISENNQYLVFTEVKTRTEGQMLSPSLSVDYKKRKRIFTAAASYIKLSKIKKQPRFDIAEVVADSKGRLRINYIKNAFFQEDDYAVF